MIKYMFAIFELIKMVHIYILCFSKETVVSRLLALLKNSKFGHDGFIELPRAGDFYHNVEVMFKEKETQIVLRRQPNTLNFEYYGAFLKCLSCFVKKKIMNSCTKIH